MQNNRGRIGNRFMQNAEINSESGSTQGKSGEQKKAAGRVHGRIPTGLWLILATAAAVLLAAAVRIGIVLHDYPQREIPLEQIYGENDQNLFHLERTGTALRAQTAGPDITFEIAADIPIRSIEYDVANVTRDNCRAYIYLRGSDRQGSVLTADGRNYIEFEGAEKSDRPYEISMIPVTVRGVSYDLLRFVINPRGHLVFLELQNYLIVLAVLVLFEAVLLELLAERRREKRPSAVSIAALASLQGLLGGIFLWQYRTAGWSELQITYHCLVLAAEGILVLLIHLPARRSETSAADQGSEEENQSSIESAAKTQTGENGKGGVSKGKVRRPELAALRIFLLSLFSFAVTELLYGDMYHLDHWDSTLLNLLIYAVPYTALYAVFYGKKRHYGYLIGMIWWLVAAMINHYYFEYRQQAFELADFSMAQTAKNVMGTYRLDVTPDVAFVYTAAALLIIGLITEIHDTLPKKVLWQKLTAVAAAAGAVVIIACNLPYVNLWNTNIGTMHRGYALSYLSFAKKHLEKPTPKGYKAEDAEAILAQYADDGAAAEGNGASEGTADGDTAAAESGTSGQTAGTGQSEEDSEKVDIIVVMNEAFSDLPTTYGFETDVDGLPYIHSLSGANVRKGWMMSSVFGGTTANTEYEFLTGNSTAFLGVESVPYTQYINSDQESLARLLKNRGYSATAFHPFLASGYKRYKVYPLLGFDNEIFSDDGLPYYDRIRTYISDSSDYQNLEKIYEGSVAEDPDEAKFIFNITMQNHGTYSSGVPAVDVTVRPTDPDLQLSQLEEYLSLACESDKAFEKLTSYYSNVDRKTIILMFGDHQPGVSNDVLKAMNSVMFGENASLEEREKQYTVPYIMWANFDLPDDFRMPERTSPNYLQTYLLEAAGVTGSAYDRFITDVREQYPAINVLGWYDASGEVHDIGTLDSEELLFDYKKVAYYNLFDHSRVKMELFE